MIPYIVHVSILLVLVYVLYWAFWQRETFYQVNRWLLILGAVLAFGLPLWTIPPGLSIWSSNLFIAEEPMAIAPAEEIAPILKKNAEVSAPAVEEEPLPPVAADPEKVSDSVALPSLVVSPIQSFNWPAMLWFIYLLGVGLFGLNLLIQLGTLLLLIFRYPSIQDGPFRIVEIERDQPPYSFLHCIFINPTRYDWDTYQQILDHEKVHIAQGHSLDMILAEMLVVLQWFNPVAWQLRRAIEQNLEYLTDHTMLHQGTDRKSYQLNLLKVSVPQHPVGLAMNYNQSILKRRIIMMNAKKSSVQSSWKYLLVLPVLGLSVSFMNAVVTPEEEGANLFQADDPMIEEISFPFPPDDLLLEAIPGDLALSEGNELAEQSDETPIQLEKSITKTSLPDWPIGSVPAEIKGVWQAKIQQNQVCVRFDRSDLDRHNHWSMSNCYPKSAFSDLPSGNDGAFTMTREAGQVAFTGGFEDNEGLGRFVFTENPEFRAYLKQQGIKGNPDEETMFFFFTADITREYVSFLKQQGFDPITVDQLKRLGIHDVSRAYITAMASAGYDDLTLDDLIKGQIHNVDPDYVGELASIGFKGLNFDELVRFSIHNVDADLVRGLKEAGFENLDPEEIVRVAIHDVDADYIQELQEMGLETDRIESVIRMAIHDVDADYVRELKEAGVDVSRTEEVIQMSIHDVDADYIKRVKAAGLEFDNNRDLIQMSIHDVDADLVASLEKAGFSNLSTQEIIQASIHGVDADYVEELAQIGLTDLDLEEVIQFQIHDIDADYIQELKELGYGDLSPEQIRRAAIHDIDPKDVRIYKEELGFDNIPIETLIRLHIHDVTPAYIRKARDRGLTDFSLEEYIRAKVHGILEDRQ